MQMNALFEIPTRIDIWKTEFKKPFMMNDSRHGDQEALTSPSPRNSRFPFLQELHGCKVLLY